MGEEEKIMAAGKKMVRVREFIMEDLPAVEELERLCQAGLSGDNAAGGGGGKKKKRGMRLGIATELVRRAEEWCAARGAAYATMATTASNAASLALFQGRFKYALFRKPRFLGHPKLTSVAANGNAAPAAGDDDDWTTAPPSSVLFVDPREF
uniref:N-acetyltransferase domain-containing protein n=1 Tax=Oryza barthii TaxID=65489 RepID=A0A0D3F1K4_9ORYZ